jgi:hypothetical protein
LLGVRDAGVESEGGVRAMKAVSSKAATQAAQRCRREGWTVKRKRNGMWDLRQGGAKLCLTEEALLKFAFGDGAAA